MHTASDNLSELCVVLEMMYVINMSGIGICSNVVCGMGRYSLHVINVAMETYTVLGNS